MGRRLLVSVGTAARELGVSKWTMYRLLREGELQYIAVHLGRSVKVSRVGLDGVVGAWYDESPPNDEIEPV